MNELTASLADRYTIERELGGGGMSRVFLARETALGPADHWPTRKLAR